MVKARTAERQKSLDDYRIEEQRQDIADLLAVCEEWLLYGTGEPGSARRRTWSRTHTLVEKHKGEANE